MDTSPKIDPTSTASLLQCLGYAIDETKLIRCIKNSKATIDLLEAENPSSHRILFLKREISNLESKLSKIRSKAGRTKTVTKIPDIR